MTRALHRSRRVRMDVGDDRLLHPGRPGLWPWWAAPDPEAAREMVERAYEGAKGAAGDLGNLVRGIRPSILDERGLDAALSALVASCPVPVSVRFDLPHRPEPTSQPVAYFVVPGAITSLSKHTRGSWSGFGRRTNGALPGSRRRFDPALTPGPF
ncbi:MAG: hypothetical protein ACRDY3_08335 [Acidimicrobiales bacterium]